MRVEKTTAVSITDKINGKTVTWTRDLSDHELEDATIAFANTIALIVQSVHDDE
tara:strand:- start:29 stop:190 length:162 start_codon:yes stop_codon:yes gene_type:complete